MFSTLSTGSPSASGGSHTSFQLLFKLVQSFIMRLGILVLAVPAAMNFVSAL